MAFVKKTNFSDCPTIRIGGTDENNKPNPKQVEGYFLGSKTTPDKGYGPGTLHFFQTETGTVGVWGKTVMNGLLTADLMGQMTRVTFTGMGPKVKGKNPAFLYDVEFDSDNRMSSAELAALSVTAKTEEGAEPEETEEEEQPTDTEEEEQAEEPTPRATPPKVAAKTPSAAQQAKVASLLGKRPA